MGSRPVLSYFVSQLIPHAVPFRVNCCIPYHTAPLHPTSRPISSHPTPCPVRAVPPRIPFVPSRIPFVPLYPPYPYRVLSHPASVPHCACRNSDQGRRKARLILCSPAAHTASAADRRPAAASGITPPTNSGSKRPAYSPPVPTPAERGVTPPAGSRAASPAAQPAPVDAAAAARSGTAAENRQVCCSRDGKRQMRIRAGRQRVCVYCVVQRPTVLCGGASCLSICE